MVVIAAMTGLIAAVLMFTAGYLLGTRRGARARERLWQQSLDLVENFKDQRRQLVEQQEEMRITVLRDDNLRAKLDQVLTPILRRERLGFELSDEGSEDGNRGDLTHLLDQIAQKGSFRAVVLTDDEGLPLASSSSAWDLDRLSGISSFLLVLADRFGRDGAPAPLSFMLHDEENNVTLSRLFRLRDKRLLLTAVSTSTELTSTALDPALARLGKVLSK